MIVWNPYDTRPDLYRIYRNDTLLANGNWNSSGESISINLDSLDIGIYNYTIIVQDVLGNTVSDLVFITVESETTTTSSTTTTTTTTTESPTTSSEPPDNGDFLLLSLIGGSLAIVVVMVVIGIRRRR